MFICAGSFNLLLSACDADTMVLSVLKQHVV